MTKIAKTSLVAIALLTSSLTASDILATVNGKNITKQDAEAFVSAASPKAHFSQLQHHLFSCFFQFILKFLLQLEK